MLAVPVRTHSLSGKADKNVERCVHSVTDDVVFV